MSKPGDIPQDIKDRVREKWFMNEVEAENWYDYLSICEAVLEERERCAGIVEGFYDAVPDQLRDAQDPYIVEAQRLIARAIRA